MCVTLAPAAMSKTTLYAGEANMNGKIVHVLGYGNVVKNGSMAEAAPDPVDSYRVHPATVTWDELVPDPNGKASVAKPANAMIIPIPARPHTVTKANIIDTSRDTQFLDEMADAMAPKTRSLSFSEPIAFSSDVQIFESGIYTVVLASDPRAIPEAIKQVPEAKRPQIDPKFFETYHDLYPGWTFALCCFNADGKSEPLLWWYEPAFPDVLFAPALDAHDGKVPDPKAQVKVDHTVMFGSQLTKLGAQVYLTPTSPEVAAVLPTHIVGAQRHGMEPNGDFIAKVADVRAGNRDIYRVQTPARAIPG